MKKANLDVHLGPDWGSEGDGPPVKAAVRGDVRLMLLVGAHVVVGLVASWYAAVEGRIPFTLEYLPLVPHLAINLSQACLLGHWAAFSRLPGWVRLVGWVLGAVGLEFLLGAGDEHHEFTGMAALVSGAISLTLLAARHRRVQLLGHPKPSDPPAPRGLRFTIRTLMLLTLAIALLMASVRGLWETLGGRPAQVLSAIWSLCFVVVGLSAAWATLGRARPLRRSLVVLALAVSLGAAFSSCVCHGWESYFYVNTITALQAVIVLGSLLVVRSCGSRLVRQPMTDSYRPREENLEGESVSR